MQALPNSVLLDVRDPLEYTLVGHPTGSVNITWKTASWAPPKVAWTLAPGFVEAVKRKYPELSTPLFLICRSGQRSVEAGIALTAAGYQQVTNIEEGLQK